MYIVYLNILLSIMYIFIRSKKNLHVLQQNFYNENNRYIKWGNKNINQVFKLDLLILIINLLNIFIKSKILYFISILYIILFIKEYNINKKSQVKIPLKITSRIKRLIFTITIIYLIPLVIYFINKNIIMFNVLYTLIININFYIMFICNIINKPIEKYVFLHYKNKAMKKINNMNLEVIGITGSYGKTSSAACKGCTRNSWFW